MPGGVGGESCSEVFSVEEEVGFGGFGADDDSAHGCTEAADVFGEGMEDKVDSEFEGSLGVGAGERVVDNSDELLFWVAFGVGFFGDVGDSFEVDEFHSGVDRSFEVEDLCVWVDGGLYRVWVGEVAGGAGDSESVEPFGDVAVRASVDGVMENDVVSGADVDADGSRDGGHSGGEADCDFTLFAEGEGFFEESGAGFIESIVDVDWRRCFAVDFGVGELLESLGAPFCGSESEGDGSGDGWDDVVLEVPLFASEFAVDKNGSVSVGILACHKANDRDDWLFISRFATFSKQNSLWSVCCRAN